MIRRAPASSAPRNTPGKASTLLIWLGKSLRPVATTAAYLAATWGWISGSGLDSANTIPLGAMVAIISSGDHTAGHPEEHVGPIERFRHAAGETVRDWCAAPERS